MESNQMNFTAFEQEIRAAMTVAETDRKFISDLRRQVMAHLADENAKKSSPNQPVFLRLHPGWTIALAILAIVIISTLAIGPQRVYAEFAKLFGYIPGAGIVDQSKPIRVLAEPVSVTRDGITITVTSATLTADRTQIQYRIFGVPGSAYPDQEDVVGCMPHEYLRLADGTQLSQINGGYEPVPADVNEAVYVMPCIVNTLPGKAPENWEIALRFVPAPPSLTVMPVIELTPSQQGSQAQSFAEDQAITVNTEIETSDGYILIGQFLPQMVPGKSFQQMGMMKISDATGKNVPYTYPQDVNENLNQSSSGMPGAGWAAQFRAAGLVYPLKLSIPGYYLQQDDSGAKAEFTFDAGSDPQPGQEWKLDQKMQLNGHNLTLASITADSRNGYSFFFTVDPEVYGAGVEIVDHTANGGGGGGSGGLTDGKFNRSVSFSSLPTGVLRVIVSNLTLISDPMTWQGEWSPATVRTDLPANPTPQPGVCLDVNNIEQLQPAPANLTNGIALMYEPIENTDKWGLVLYNLDGNGKQVLATDASWGSISTDGKKMAYPDENGFHVIDLATKNEQLLAGANGFNLNWSPDGKQIAFIKLGDGDIDSLFTVNLDGSGVHKVSDWSYQSIVGWSPDGKLYSVVPYTGGAAWKVYSFDLATAASQELFTIENGTPKFLNPQLSADGKWIAYRGRDNSSVYLVHPDGSDMHLVIDNAGVVGIEWSRSGWLVVSLGQTGTTDGKVILLNPESCQAYLLPGLHGQIEGLYLP